MIIREVRSIWIEWTIQEYGKDPALMTKSLFIQFDGLGRRAVVTRRQALLRQGRNVYGFVFIPPEKGGL